jgi:hypothetical protein
MSDFIPKQSDAKPTAAGTSTAVRDKTSFTGKKTAFQRKAT